MENEKLYNIKYGNNENDYISRYLKKGDIIGGCLSEAKAFDIFFSDMIMCNNYFNGNDFNDIDTLISSYDEEEDYNCDEYQYFIVNFEYDEELTKKAVKKWAIHYIMTTIKNCI